MESNGQKQKLEAFLAECELMHAQGTNFIDFNHPIFKKGRFCSVPTCPGGIYIQNCVDFGTPEAKAVFEYCPNCKSFKTLVYPNSQAQPAYCKDQCPICDGESVTDRNVVTDSDTCWECIGDIAKCLDPNCGWTFIVRSGERKWISGI